MKKVFTLLFSVFIVQVSFADNSADSVLEIDARYFDPRFEVTFSNNSYLLSDDKNIFGVKKYPPVIDSISGDILFRNENASFGRKLLRGGSFVVGAQSLTMGFTYLLPADFTNWDGGPGSHRQSFINAFTMAPVLDEDPWYVNFVGHPWQGSYYYNAYRSQGAKIWQSALMSVGHSFLWEYMAESWFERPSVQDLIVTPVLGSLVGEAVHRGTMSMSRNGFQWYEKVFVCIFNPMFALNNGFKAYRPVY